MNWELVAIAHIYESALYTQVVATLYCRCLTLRGPAS